MKPTDIFKTVVAFGSGLVVVAALAYAIAVSAESAYPAKNFTSSACQPKEGS